MSIGLIIVATSKYINFIPELYESWNKYFFINDTRKIFLFTDKEFSAENVNVFKIKHEIWPYITLKRFHFIMDFKDKLNTDYLFWLDADMIINDYIDKEVLGDLVGTLHQGYIGKRGTPEKNNKSTACLSSNDCYYTGCFWGGKKEYIFKMAETLKKNIDIDSKNNIIAIWHDESHLNWYFEHNKPKILGPEYNFWYKNPITKPKISVRQKENKELHI